MPGESVLGVVMGDGDLVRPLQMAGVRCAIFAEPGEPVRRARDVTALPWRDHWTARDEVVDVLLSYAEAIGHRPVLYPQTDGDLLTLSRNRDRLALRCELLLADIDVVEASADKAAFAQLASWFELPVPRSQGLDAAQAGPEDVELTFPIVVKPLLRRASAWHAIESAAKAVHVETRAELTRMWPRLQAGGICILAQEAIAGDETRMESYHAYVDPGGELVAAFTGRKIRTLPLRYGHSSALVITDERDVAELGRDIVRRLDVCGVMKIDFKRDADGTLWLLEINPRFTLWHHPAAIAGLNIPALVHADLTGQPRPAFGPARPGVTWCHPSYDVRAAREAGVPFGSWLRFVRGCDAVSPGTLVAPVTRRLELLR